jgi:transitional endoplasmic reticulum ATPase
MQGDDAIAPLREAARFSPENVPLRLHLAGLLLRNGRPDEAETEYREVLRLAPDHVEAKLGLCDAFFQNGKPGEALVVIESVVNRPNAPPKALLRHARLLVASGERERAANAYRRAIEFDPTLADADLARSLGVGVGAGPAERIPVSFSEEQFASEGTDVERPLITFADVGGMEDLKEEIRLKIVHPVQHAELYRAYGKKPGGGILMYGPPGCGKTHLARATAGELGAGFIPVGIEQVLELWVGSSERNLHAIFEQARRTAPSVLFFDEVDALASRRSDHRQGAIRTVINQFLAELDGVNDANDGVLVLGATNAPWLLDPAFRRPGRFDRVLFVPPPDPLARAAILRVHLRGKPVEGIDADQVAKRTDGFSGADIESLIDIAVEEKLGEAIRGGTPQPLRTRDLLAAAGRIRPSIDEWTASARNYALFANHGGAYDDVLAYLKQRGKV